MPKFLEVSDKSAARSAIDAVGNTPASVVSAGGVSIRSAIHHNPANSADNAITAGTDLDSGEVFSNTGNRKIKFADGRFKHDPAAASGSNTAGYLQVECADVVRSMRAEVAWASSAIGAVAFVVPSTLAEWNFDTSSLPAAGVHLTAYGNGIWNIAVWNPAPGSPGHIDHSVQPGTATSFTLTVQTSTPSSTQTTASIAADASAAQVKSALEALSNVAADEVTVLKSPSGNFGLIWDTGLGSVTVTATASGGTMGMSAPLPTDESNTIDPVVTYGTGLTQYGSYTTVGRYDTVWDDELRWLDVLIYPETDEVLVLFPDGSNSGMLRHPGIGLLNSSRAVFELFENNTASVDTPASLGRIAADSQQTVRDSPFIDNRRAVELLSSAAPVTLYAGGNTTTSDITANGAIPAGTRWIELVLIAGGGGGGGGGCQTSGTAVNGGSGGGSGGVIKEIIPASALGTTWNATIGKGGLGGASISATGDGTNGTAGTTSKFISLTGSTVLAHYQTYPGGPGLGGKSGATIALGGYVGGPFATAGANSGVNGAAGGGGGQMFVQLGNPASGAGGGITTAPAANNGGAGGSNLVRGYTGGTAGVVGGANPGRGTDSTATPITTTPAGTPGPGAGGGAASISGAAQDGADSAAWGVGGGGGGASLNGSASGAGGDGKGGYLIAIAHFA